jgi:hypothetical protein
MFAIPIALALLGAGGWLLWPRAAITRYNAAKLEAGMTLAEVEAILGGPARVETTGPVEPDIEMDEPQIAFRGQRLNIIEWVLEARHFTPMSHPGREWRSDRVSIFVRFDADGHVDAVDSYPLRPVREERLLDKLRSWLRL